MFLYYYLNAKSRNNNDTLLQRVREHIFYVAFRKRRHAKTSSLSLIEFLRAGKGSCPRVITHIIMLVIVIVLHRLRYCIINSRVRTYESSRPDEICFPCLIAGRFRRHSTRRRRMRRSFVHGVRGAGEWSERGGGVGAIIIRFLVSGPASRLCAWFSVRCRWVAVVSYSVESARPHSTHKRHTPHISIRVVGAPIARRSLVRGHDTNNF